MRRVATTSAGTARTSTGIQFVSTYSPAPATPPVLRGDPARQHSSIRLEALADYDEAELVNAGECGQVRVNEGSVEHVEVFPMGGVRTPIIGRPRPLPRHRRADHDHYTAM